jgi:DeoR/GlpR family transcriptional regulator of sugar metabolism
MTIGFLEYDEKGVFYHLNITTTDRMLTRVKDVYLYVRENGTVTTKNIVDEFDITSRTAQRDLNVLKYNDLITSPVRGKWTTTSKEVIY